MNLFALEHSKAAYFADFALYGAAIAVLSAVLVVAGPRGQGLSLSLIAMAGLTAWTAIEYVLHRFVLHGLQPFSRWHAEHHDRPVALICAPTVLSASLIMVLVFLPVMAVEGAWRAGATTLGVLVGYLFYAVTHHATHHWRAKGAWLAQRKRWHSLHHHRVAAPGCYGVTTAFWDHVFGSAGDPRRRDARR